MSCHVQSSIPQRWLPGTTHKQPFSRVASCKGTQTDIRRSLCVRGSSSFR